jgi:hypothetical protein
MTEQSVTIRMGNPREVPLPVTARAYNIMPIGDNDFVLTFLCPNPPVDLHRGLSALMGEAGHLEYESEVVARVILTKDGILTLMGLLAPHVGVRVEQSDGETDGEQPSDTNE